MKLFLAEMMARLYKVIAEISIEEFLKESDDFDKTFTCEVTYRYYAPRMLLPPKGYSLGVPEEPHFIEIVGITYNGTDVSSYVTDAQWEKLQEDILRDYE